MKKDEDRNLMIIQTDQFESVLERFENAISELTDKFLAELSESEMEIVNQVKSSALSDLERCRASLKSAENFRDL